MKTRYAFMALAIAVLAVGAFLFTDSAVFAMPVEFSDQLQAINMAAAMGMMIPARRGILTVRADGGNAILAELQRAFEQFKEAHAEELKGIKAKFADVVQTEKVDRINAHITELQAALDETNQQLAAAQLGGTPAKPISAERRAYSQAFNDWFRSGDNERELKALAVKAAMQTDSSGDGGYLVPEEMESAIDRVATTVSAMRSLAQVMSIGTGTYKKLVGQGGAGYGWVGERQSRIETDTPTLEELAFTVMEIYANPAATQTMLDDARVDVGAWLGGEVDIVFAEQEGAAFVSGNGANKPRGILAYDTVANASWTWKKLGYIASGVAAALTDGSNNGLDALLSVVYGTKPTYRMGASWLMNRSTMATVRKIKDTTGQYLWQPSVQVGQPATLLGYPLVDDDNMSDIGANAFPIAFGDFRRGYLILDRTGTRVLRDPFTNKPYVHFYTTKRVGGGVQNFEAIKLLKIAAS